PLQITAFHAAIDSAIRAVGKGVGNYLSFNLIPVHNFISHDDMAVQLRSLASCSVCAICPGTDRCI
ncbi:hypothetical protein, partial [Aurantimonas coralicida]|uniref:hypothetical protein n=1 Tax=Aurantimonas coralicida TaxID=182270 RepID=UPI001D186CF1